MEVKTKECSRCQKEKPFSEFYRHPGTADKRSSMCKDCAKKYAKELREKKKQKDEDAYLNYHRKKAKEHRERERKKLENNKVN